MWGTKMDENKLKFIDVSQVPTGRVQKGKWEVIFDSLPAGKALVITKEEASDAAVRSALYNFHYMGQFKNLDVRKVVDKDGAYKMYVINNNVPVKSSK